MFKFIPLLLCAIFSFNFLNAQSSNNLKRINDALTKAKEDQKYVFVNYRTTSCELSDMMNEQMQSETCKSLFNKDYVTVDILVPREKTTTYFSGKTKDDSFPFWYILDDNGNLIETSIDAKGKNSGFPSTTTSVTKFIIAIGKTSSLSDKELNVIGKSFRLANTARQLYSSK